MKPRPSLYNGAIRKKLAIFLKEDQLFAFNWDVARKKNSFVTREASSNWVECVAFDNGLWL